MIRTDPAPTPDPVRYLKGDQPYTDRKTIQKILGETTGDVRILDQYVGEGTLALLLEIPDTCSVRVLTIHLVPDAGKVQRAIKAFVKQRPSFEFRRSRSQGLHDRYLIDDSRMLIIGHGLNDVGNKESFVTELDARQAGDLIQRAGSYFDKRWKTAKLLP